MAYHLAIGDRVYSSWSLRGWLLFEKMGLPVQLHHAFMRSAAFEELLQEFAPSRSVPALKIVEEGAEPLVVADSLAIAETLHERHPEAGIWPSDLGLRALARMLCAQMHAGFTALRSACPMNLRDRYLGVEQSDALMQDLARLEALWGHARAKSQSDGPWLFGAYSAADAFFAPVATRIYSYDLPVSDAARAYVEAHLQDPSFRRWRAMGLAAHHTQPQYKMDLPREDWALDWVTPATVSADAAHSVNSHCPYSGDAVTDFLTYQGKVYGFCNAFCRDKTLYDPTAWPAFMALAR